MLTHYETCQSILEHLKFGDEALSDEALAIMALTHAVLSLKEDHDDVPHQDEPEAA